MSISTIVEKNLIERVDFLQLSVSNLGKAKEWYATHFGYKEDYNDGKLCVMMAYKPNGLPTLLLSESGEQFNGFLIGDKKAGTVGLHCIDIKELQAYMEQQQIEMTEIEDGGFAFFMNFFDLDGNIFEVIQLKKST
jgi:predicted lactoylglutathione lyase